MWGRVDTSRGKGGYKKLLDGGKYRVGWIPKLEIKKGNC